jgi:hypothetical protein
MANQTPPDAEAPQEPGQDETGTVSGEVSVQRIEVMNLILVAIAAAVSLTVSRPFFWGVVSGGALTAANFRILAGVIRSVFLKKGVNALNVGLYWVKFAAILGAVGALILWVKVDGVGFVVGLSTMLVAVTVEAVLRLIPKK